METLRIETHNGVYEISNMFSFDIATDYQAAKTYDDNDRILELEQRVKPYIEYSEVTNIEKGSKSC